MSDEAKGKIYLLFFLIVASAVGYYFWNNVRPKILLENCTEAALQASQTYSRVSLPSDNPKSYDEIRKDCLKGLGYSQDPTEK